MAIQVVRAEDELRVEHLVSVVYATPGLGKSSLGFTASKPILFDFDRGAHRAANRKDIVRVDTWANSIAPIEDEDLKPYDTAIVDTAGRCIEFLSDFIMQRDKGLRRKDGSLTIQGYGVLKTEFGRWIAWLRRQSLDVVLLAHVQESGDGENQKERIDVTGGSKNEIYKMADLMGTIRIAGGQRVVEFDPTEATFGKNPAGFATTVFPNPAKDPELLATLIEKTKEAINEMSDEQRVEYQRQTDLRNAFSEYASADQFNKTVTAMQEANADRVDKSILMDAAKAKGILWDREDSRFVDPEPKPEEEQAATGAEQQEEAAGKEADAAQAEGDAEASATGDEASGEKDGDLLEQQAAAG